jgi:exodeoxyribonuclease V gamma subunit
LLFVERSNRTERLLGALARRWAAPRPDPLRPALVVVQGKGMERWIAQTLASGFGVCANTEFLFPRGLLERALGVGGGVGVGTDGGVGAGGDSDAGGWAADPRWEPRRLVWWLARRLEIHREDPELERLAVHLQASDGDWRRIQLAHQLASLFDHYIVHRPDRVVAWPEADLDALDPEERWQAWLFRGLVEDLGGDHLAARALSLVRVLRESSQPDLAAALRALLPASIEVFAISTLAPLYLEVLDGLARVIDVHLSVLSPSRAYWGDLWRELRDEAREADARPRAAEERETDERANEASDLISAPVSATAGLLAGLGRLGGELQSCLEQCTTYQEGEREGETDLFEDPTEGQSCPSLLARLQASFLDLEDAVAEIPVAREDDSIRVHVCHGPKRELEVLENLLRDAFERDPSLRPEDVIVMAPQIDALASDIEAVFGVSGEDASAIPHRIADRGPLRRSPVAEAFGLLLELLPGRAGRSEILGWLARAPVRERFGLDAAGVEQLAEWAERAGIRFGLDATHRARLGLAESSLHAWSGGLDRLALAHAVGPSDEVFEGLRPEPLGGLADPSLLGAVGEIQTRLASARREIEIPRSVAAWCAWLGWLLEETLAHDPLNAHEHAAIRAILSETRTAAEAAGFDSPVRFEAVRERIRGALEAAAPAQGFLSGGVTFCELVPLRAIPFRVVAILGLGDTEFPRGRPAPGYDLMARNPRPGDRSPRQDDRHLFLEALLSARDRLILTVPGRDLRDGSHRPPSVVISELLDTLDSGFRLAPSRPETRPTGARPDEEPSTLRDWLVVEHPLQGFSARYFEAGGDPRLCGGDREAFEGARARRQLLLATETPPRRFLGAPLPFRHPPAHPSAPELRTLELAELCERILRSTRYFARERLGLRMPRPEGVVGDADPFVVTGLERYQLGSALLDHLQAGASIEEAERRLRASVLLPAGGPGRLAARALRTEVEAMLRLARPYREGERLEDPAFELGLEGVEGLEGAEELGPARIRGRLDDLWPAGRTRLDFARVGGAGELELWIRHLVLCALVEEGLGCGARSVLVGRPASGRTGKRVVTFGPVEGAREQLATLFEWAWSVESAPLPFFSRSSRRYAERRSKPELAWREAAGELFGRETSSRHAPSAELERDLESQRIWEGGSPLERLDDRPLLFGFDELARRFFEPLLAARKDSSE